MTELSRRAVLAGTAATAATAATAFPIPYPDTDPDARIYQLATETETAIRDFYRIIDATEGMYDRLAGPADDEHLPPASPEAMALRHARIERLRAHPDHPAFIQLVKSADHASNRHFDLEQETRTMPAKTLPGVVFKLRHLTSDSVWQEEVTAWIQEVIAQAIADLEQIAAGGAS